MDFGGIQVVGLIYLLWALLYIEFLILAISLFAIWRSSLLHPKKYIVVVEVSADTAHTLIKRIY